MRMASIDDGANGDNGGKECGGGGGGGKAGAVGAVNADKAIVVGAVVKVDVGAEADKRW